MKGKHLVSPIILYPGAMKGRDTAVVEGRQMEKRDRIKYYYQTGNRVGLWETVHEKAG